MRIMSLDVGEKRIGMAVSDALCITAQPLETLSRKGAMDFEFINKTALEKDVDEIIVGLPLNMDGTAGEKAKMVSDFMDGLKKVCTIPLKIWDERLTTRQATRLLIEADVSRKKRKNLDDKLAAQIILQSYLDSRTVNKED